MKDLSTAGSTYYKSRAGTAYSVVKRLIKFGLVENNGDLIQVTSAGVERLQQWLTPPIPLSEVAYSADLVRLRFYFLQVIDADERLAYIDDVESSIREFLKKCIFLIKESERIGDYFGSLALLSAVMENKARLEWLKIVRQWVECPIQDQGTWAETILTAAGEHS
jgi:hypothetical protein